MAQAAKETIDDWVVRIQKTRSSRELLKLLEQFRKHDWTDQERQKVSHTYMRVLDVILKSPSEQIKKEEVQPAGNDGPVWYEKM